MNSKVIVALFCLLAVSFGATLGTVAITCTTATSCDNTSCNAAGTTGNNWQLAAGSTNTCVVIDCDKVNTVDANQTVSSNACKSCSTTKTVAASDNKSCVASSAKVLIASVAVLAALLF